MYKFPNVFFNEISEFIESITNHKKIKIESRYHRKENKEYQDSNEEVLLITIDNRIEITCTENVNEINILCEMFSENERKETRNFFVDKSTIKKQNKIRKQELFHRIQGILHQWL